MNDYITCSYCGVVERGHVCPYKTYYKQAKNGREDKFRKSKAWTDKSIEVRQRDRYLCRVCEAGLYNTVSRYNFNKLEVHHIDKLTEDYNKRLDNDNLITLCSLHHKMADSGEIPKEVLRNLVPPEG